MITLDAESLRDFQTCELLYRYRHLDKRHEPISHRDMLLDRFGLEIKKVLSFFFYKKQAGQTPSYNALLNRWERSWFAEDVTAYDIAVARQEPHVVNTTNLATRAAGVLLHFHNDFADSILQPLIIDEAVSVSINNKVRLKTVFDIGLRNPKTDELLIMKWSTKQKGAWGGDIDYGLDFVISDYIFQKKNSLAKQCTVAYAIYDIGMESNKLKQVRINDQYRNQLDYWIDYAGNKDVLVPRRGLTVACKSCPFNKPCKFFDEYSLELDDE